MQIQFDQLFDAFERLRREAEEAFDVGFLGGGDLLGVSKDMFMLLRFDR
ncbi:hypothetical protein [Burkholderia thailandensis]|nr:hypothetical protein [Burkholderia thailandensis]